ncbi:hypothetical protein CH302_07420 [Rhodococcus sp. 15-2388-1-1a]|nr:hypothetical protein CH302_07420 [Rhodococcus sp. 15-2388-1-1a]
MDTEGLEAVYAKYIANIDEAVNGYIDHNNTTLLLEFGPVRCYVFSVRPQLSSRRFHHHLMRSVQHPTMVNADQLHSVVG